MKTYEVIISGTFHYPINIEEENEEKAKEEALKEFEKDIDGASKEIPYIDYHIRYVEVIGEK